MQQSLRDRPVKAILITHADRGELILRNAPREWDSVQIAYGYTALYLRETPTVSEGWACRVGRVVFSGASAATAIAFLRAPENGSTACVTEWRGALFAILPSREASK